MALCQTGFVVNENNGKRRKFVKLWVREDKHLIVAKRLKCDEDKSGLRRGWAEMRIAAAVALAFGLVISGESQANADAMGDDVRCLASISMIPEMNKQTHLMSDEFVKSMTLMGTIYYMGKITGRDPQFDIESALIKELPQMATQEIKSNLVRCGGELQAQGKRWRAIGSDLIHRGQEMSHQQSTSPQL